MRRKTERKTGAEQLRLGMAFMGDGLRGREHAALVPKPNLCGNSACLDSFIQHYLLSIYSVPGTELDTMIRKTQFFMEGMLVQLITLLYMMARSQHILLFP